MVESAWVSKKSNDAEKHYENENRTDSKKRILYCFGLCIYRCAVQSRFLLHWRNNIDRTSRLHILAFQKIVCFGVGFALYSVLHMVVFLFGEERLLH